ncbi:YkgJ family cysteine cluster protein [Bacteroidota bacterium]
MNDSLNVCLACGLCCDGTLIGFVQVASDELFRLKKLMEIEDSGNNGFFLQPCDNYCDGCSIYTKRPKQCIDFKCGLLTSVETKQLDFNSANEIIALVKFQKNEIEKKLASQKFVFKSQSFYFKMIELKKQLDKIKPASLKPFHKELRVHLTNLNCLLLNRFDLSFF